MEALDTFVESNPRIVVSVSPHWVNQSSFICSFRLSFNSGAI